MVRSSICERARMWASLRLDGELSELEGALLDAHLGRCAECASAVAVFAVSASTLREEALAPVTLAPPRRRGSTRTFLAAAAATLLVTFALAGAGVVGAVHVVASGPAPPKLVHVSAVAGGTDDFRLLAKVRTLRTEKAIATRILWPV
jgi:predicted anti-sigma-YlaC factor YlaD